MIEDRLLLGRQCLIKRLDRRLCRLQRLEPHREELLHPVHPVEHREFLSRLGARTKLAFLLLLGLSGVVAILFGIAMFAEPGDDALVVLSLIAAFALVTGVTEIVFAVGAKRMVADDVKRVLTPRPQTSST